MCLSLAGMTWAAAVPTKPSLSFKDKLALDLPIKQHPTTQKAEGKTEVVKVAFPTTTPEPQRSTERPQYVEATLFRHQFTTPPGFVTELEPLDDYELSFDYQATAHDYEGHFRVWDDVSSFAGELGASGRDLRQEAYIGGYRPLGF